MEFPPWYVTVPVTVAGMYVTAVLLRSLTRKRCDCVKLLKGKTVIVTGANSGIGLHTALELVKREAHVILACRDVSKANAAMDFIKSQTSRGTLESRLLDLSSFSSVRQFCKKIFAEVDHIDILINNAGILGHPYKLSEDNIEMHMAVNHFSNFLLTNLLLPKLKESSPSRVVFVSSTLHKRGKIDLKNLTNRQTNGYANSKLANVYFARELSERMKDSKIGVFTVHPGMVDTNIARYSVSDLTWKLLYPLRLLFLKTANQGCQSVVYCAVSEDLNGKSGGYYGNCRQEPWPDASSNKETQQKLWDRSIEITGL